jgi:catechol 2,3-dioxygenase-like lactoylglutathione lyase family enzyme
VPATLDHATVCASDFAASLRFYDAALGALGLVRAAEFGDEEEDDAEVEAAGWAAPDGEPLVWLVAGPRPTTGVHVSLRADSRADVERFHAAALAHGGRSQDAPRRWLLYRRGQFGAQVRDPDGNVIEAVTSE